MATLRNGKHALVKFAEGGGYEGEWLNGMRSGRGINTWADGSR